MLGWHVSYFINESWKVLEMNLLNVLEIRPGLGGYEKGFCSRGEWTHASLITRVH